MIPVVPPAACCTPPSQTHTTFIHNVQKSLLRTELIQNTRLLREKSQQGTICAYVKATILMVAHRCFHRT